MRQRRALARPKRQLKELVRSLDPVVLEKDSAVVLAMFCGKGEFYEGLACLYSFYRFTDHKYPLYWFDDGTMTETEISILRSGFVNSHFISLAATEGTVGKWLETEGLSSISRMRKDLIFGKRMTNILYTLSGKFVLQLDSDVLFLNEPTLLLQEMRSAATTGSAGWYYNVDVRPSYCTTDENIGAIIGEQVVPSFNAGVVFFRANPDDLRYLETVNAQGLVVNDIFFWEQTLFAILATRYHARPLPDDYEVHFKHTGSNTGRYLSVASRHYCSDSRRYLYDHFSSHVIKRL